jgi:hypothetical protein
MPHSWDQVTRQLQPGMRVYTEDGQELGPLVEVRPGCFRIQAAWRRSYWLPVDAIDAVETDQITLLLPAAWVPACRLPGPTMSAAS